jgi:hypothetical protein
MWKVCDEKTNTFASKGIEQATFGMVSKARLTGYSFVVCVLLLLFF